jgi:hypothetical protein
MPFPVQRVQTDRGGEFFAHEVQGELRERRIEFRPNGSSLWLLSGYRLCRSTREGDG